MAVEKQDCFHQIAVVYDFNGVIWHQVVGTYRETAASLGLTAVVRVNLHRFCGTRPLVLLGGP